MISNSIACFSLKMMGLSSGSRLSVLRHTILASTAIVFISTAMVHAQPFAVVVKDGSMAPLKGAEVSLRMAGSTVWLKPRKEGTNMFVFKGLPEGRATIAVARQGYEPQEREVMIAYRGRPITFYLGKKGDHYTYFDGGLFPFEMRNDRIALFVAPRLYDTVKAFVQSLGLNVAEDNRDGMMVLRGGLDMSSRQSPELQALRSSPLIEGAGPILLWRNKRYLAFANEFRVRFHSRAGRKEIDSMLTRPEVIRFYQDLSTHEYVVEVDKAIGYSINDIMRDVAKSELVEGISVSYHAFL